MKTTNSNNNQKRSSYSKGETVVITPNQNMVNLLLKALIMEPQHQRAITIVISRISMITMAVLYLKL